MLPIIYLSSYILYRSIPNSFQRKMITTSSIESFSCFSAPKNLNDKHNKVRENIISSIINGEIPPHYFENEQWMSLKTNIDNYLDQLNERSPYSSVVCKQKGGRKYNYDFDIIFKNVDGHQTLRNVEFKFNVNSVNQTPQFVSPVKTSQYMTHSYEEYFFDNYIPQLSALSGFPIPNKETYLKEIHSNMPECMKQYQSLYYSGCKASTHFTGDERAIEFYNICKELSAESIQQFIEMADLRPDVLCDYLIKFQSDKIYMLFSKKSEIILEKTNIDDYIIDPASYIKNPQKFRFECQSVNGKPIHILLRWKNGNGIAFPSFQIS